VILVGCEESQVITKALRDAGYEAYSCDILPTRGNSDWHYQEDIANVIPRRQWDMIILHPECTEMAVCANGTYAYGKPQHQARLDAIEWTLALWGLAKKHSSKVALENPASVIWPHLRRAGAVVQFVQPWMFGHTETKKTGFALHGLPPLTETENVFEEMQALPNKEKHRIWYMSPGENRSRDRSETYRGIANAIVTQWGKLI
jgi:hypothetical protein